MSERPEERNKDSKKSADNIEQSVDKQDLTEMVQVGGAKEGKGTAL